jgi:hypothetical protein
MAGSMYDALNEQYSLEPVKKYYDRKSGLEEAAYFERLKNSTTLYVGNLSFFTNET